MFCPQCGQQQISAETRFCSRCGLPLDLVAEVVAHGGTLPEIEGLHKSKRKLFSRRNGLFFSLLWFLFFVLLLTPFWAIVGVEELAAISAVTGIFGGFIIMLSSLFFLNNNPKNQLESKGVKYGQRNLGAHRTQNALPPQQTYPVSDYVQPQAGSWRSTEDLEPTSVTEDTTKLLKEEELEK